MQTSILQSWVRNIGIIGLFVQATVIATWGAEIYVSPSGSDTTGTGSSCAPYRTIWYAYHNFAAPGVTIIVMPGTYTDYYDTGSSGWGLRLYKSGTASNPIILRSQVKGQAVLDAENNAFRQKGIYIDGSLGGGDYHIIDGFQIKQAVFHGIYIDGDSHFNQILNNEIHNNGTGDCSTWDCNIPKGQGVFSDPASHNNSYIGNYIHDNGVWGSNLDHGLYLCGDDELVINNVIVGNAAIGLQIAGYTTVANMKVYNNVMAYNGRSGIVLWKNVSGVDIKNNIIYRNGQSDIRAGISSWEAHGSGVVIDKNIVLGNTGGNYNLPDNPPSPDDNYSDYQYTLGTTIESEPLFVNSNPEGFDAHLQSGSPAIDAGLNLSSFFTVDKEGTARPQGAAWDIGAYEFKLPIWVDTGEPMDTARRYFTATLLPSGKVLVAGGYVQNPNAVSLNSAELYDPSTDSWTPTGNSMTTGRYWHTATLLPNGKVLVTGGHNIPGGVLNQAELYDPNDGPNGSWSPLTQTMSTARYFHSATLLPGGKVLVAGGWNGTTAFSSAELYDACTGSWTTTGSMGTGRFRPAATLLSDGRVLVAGGRNSSGVLSSAETYTYDPGTETGSWTPANSMGTPRDTHTATLLPNGKVLVAGGNGGGFDWSSAELYNPATGTWTYPPSMSLTRSAHTATLLSSGKVLIAGGIGASVVRDQAELYDPANGPNGTWSLTDALTTPRYAHTATLLSNGKVLAVGGYNTTIGYLNSAEVY
jgi:Kelch motif protein/galactose oxidase-like protein